MYGEEPSLAARHAIALFLPAGVRSVLELGAGQGRDTLFFARQGLTVCAVEYTWAGVSAITRMAQRLGQAARVRTIQHDVRERLPFLNGSFDACYSHMLYNMALTTEELRALSGDIRRVLRPAGLNVFTARNTADAHYGHGVCHGEDLYEAGGYIVHFFSRATIEHVAEGYSIESISEFEEGALPRRLFLVTLRRES